MFKGFLAEGQKGGHSCTSSAHQWCMPLPGHDRLARCARGKILRHHPAGATATVQSQRWFKRESCSSAKMRHPVLIQVACHWGGLVMDRGLVAQPGDVERAHNK